MNTKPFVVRACYRVTLDTPLPGLQTETVLYNAAQWEPEILDITVTRVDGGDYSIRFTVTVDDWGEAKPRCEGLFHQLLSRAELGVVSVGSFIMPTHNNSIRA